MACMALGLLLLAAPCLAVPAVQKFDSGGVSREYFAYMPSSSPPTGLIIGLHGAGGSGADMCEWSVRASVIASVTGAVVVCPTSTKYTSGAFAGKKRRLLGLVDGSNISSDFWEHEKKGRMLAGRVLQKKKEMDKDENASPWTMQDDKTWLNSETGQTWTPSEDEKKAAEKAEWLKLPDGTGWANIETGQVYVEDTSKDSGDKKEDTGNTWKAFPSHDDAGDVDFLAELIEHLKAEHQIPAGRVLMAGFSNGASMCYHFVCEKPDLIDGLVVADFPFTYPWEPFGDAKPPYEHCQSSSTKKTPLYTVCGTEDPYCNMGSGFLVNWQDYSVGILGCEGDLQEVGEFPNYPHGPMICYGYESCPAMNTACSVSGYGHMGFSVDDAIHHAFGTFFEMDLEELPAADFDKKKNMGNDDDAKSMEKTSGEPVETAPETASPSFASYLSGICALVVFANCFATV
eukprot:gnl/TRDRNA2_/TRDRNA2_159809_c0_seq2.p1 gnl/TRDRNA2_/TRDRNA2_159809_c0~~gnl/TRDRNA2_/TRDRNA2_159809_c0_seq2.p1  ORF type:complete len:458 (-),score=45.99 gnl/TRDRNA2_/TRDRNA2_159809_c0_seq2:59-1432(-)